VARFLLVLTLAAMAGCATTAGLEPTSKISGFDGARVVDIAPHGAACTAMECTALGLQWSSAAPGSAVLTAAVMNRIVGITSAKIAIDGKVHSLAPMPGLTSFSRPGDPVKVSRRGFVASMDLVRAMATAKTVWLRIGTTEGYAEDLLIDGQKDSKAIHAARRFLAAVDGA
jgi:hypothetical protein